MVNWKLNINDHTLTHKAVGAVTVTLSSCMWTPPFVLKAKCLFSVGIIFDVLTHLKQKSNNNTMLLTTDLDFY